MTRIGAVVPAFNEQRRIEATVKALAGFCDAVIVVDDGSSDQTGVQARAAGALVVTLAENRGKGAALAAGVAASDADVLVLADADLQDSASLLQVIVDPVLSGRADLAIAAPPPGRRSGAGLVEGFARFGIKRLTGKALSRPLSGQRALRREVALRLGFAPGFGAEVASTIDAHRAGLRIIEVPCAFSHAKTGRDMRGFLHRARQGVDVAAVLLRRSLRSTA